MAQLTEENDELRAAVEGKAAELYDAMRQKLAHTDKHFTEVGKKQHAKECSPCSDLHVAIPE